MEKIISTTRRPDITFSDNGVIHITARVARILHLTEDSCINIAKEKGEYLLFAENYTAMIGNHIARCYPVNTGGRYFRANSVKLCRAVLKACGVLKKAALMCGEAISINGKTYIPIITGTTL